MEQRRDHRELNRTDIPKRPVYDYLRLHCLHAATRYGFVELVDNRFKRAEQWVNAQIEGFHRTGRATLTHQDMQDFESLIAYCHGYRAQALEGNNRFLKRSQDRDTRDIGFGNFYAYTRDIEDRILHKLSQSPNQRDQQIYNLLSLHLGRAEEDLLFLERNKDNYDPPILQGTKYRFVVGFQKEYEGLRAAIIPSIASLTKKNAFTEFIKHFNNLAAYRQKLENNLRDRGITPIQTS